MDLELTVRRNRRRIRLLVAAAVTNYAVILGLFGGVFFWSWAYEDIEGLAAPVWWIVTTSLLFGYLAAAAVVWFQLGGLTDRTVKALGAIELTEGDRPLVDNLLAGLSLATGTPPLRAALLRDDAPNAIAVGTSPKNTLIVLTSGLLEKCGRYETEAVLAVEVCSVRRYDTALQSVGLACAAGAIGFHRFFRDEKSNDLRQLMMAWITWPSMAIAEVLRAAALHSADFGADAMALTVTRHPQALDKALAKLDADPSVVQLHARPTAPLWFEPVPYRASERVAEFRRFVGTASLAERRERLPHVRA